MRPFVVVAVLALAPCGVLADERPTMAGVLEASSDSDWRTLDPVFTLYMKLPAGMVIMELAPEFAPNVIQNIRVLTKADYFAETAIVRSQENYVAQWGVPEGRSGKSPGDAAATVDAEFYRPLEGLEFITVDSRDAYADQVGFVGGFPAGNDGQSAWLLHCNGMLGVGRDMAPESGNGTELYVVTGHAPRHLDRNVVVIGRVLQGMELLTTLPRGTGALGFYEDPAETTPIEYMRFAKDVPADERVALQVLRTDTKTFQQLVEARRYRAEDWFVDPTGRVGICNIPLPVRVTD